MNTISSPRNYTDSFSQDISRAFTSTKPKLHDTLPPAPPPSPVSFAVDATGKPNKSKHEKIPSLSLE
ncbi:uncharacterized protein N7469_003611 [Penicillium citrinum]|uniref:Uncharacterized protein n=2 Tax=Penicillium TaxID=5073 RepID=A0A9W9TQE6_PENCI|nr:uncharacterized protein N7469_003611 [Penicillium citrinum]KAJ5234443.1 hypothetical protein N7469_003611 [Penicillium citrinum]KAJ5590063.1 hypothetical protein N7450_004035 [Penicillium hetheringtonii]KAK5801037.1 hypothetical protein VI817_003249 [Penicillium citrinum]